MIPDTARLADLPRVCLQESEEIPPDYTRLFNSRRREGENARREIPRL